KSAQQEMVGFVLIVVLVVIGLMVFLVVSINSNPEEQDSLEVGNMLDSILRHTTDCAIVFEPQYDSFEDLFKSCYKGDRCNNLNQPACEYLNDSLTNLLKEIMKSESTIQAYQISLSEKGGGGLLLISEGDCTTSKMTSASQRNLVSGNQQLIIRMKICREV
ncbi:MAG: hypothetical protein NUV97_03285, partial [archaeon]|nr:hypothetical protein [archaeon]